MKQINKVIKDISDVLPPRWARRLNKEGSVVRDVFKAVYLALVQPLDERIKTLEQRVNNLENKNHV